MCWEEVLVSIKMKAYTYEFCSGFGPEVIQDRNHAKGIGRVCVAQKRKKKSIALATSLINYLCGTIELLYRIVKRVGFLLTDVKRFCPPPPHHTPLPALRTHSSEPVRRSVLCRSSVGINIGFL